MSPKAKPIPDGFERTTPYLICHDAKSAIEYYISALDAKELSRMPMPDGKIGHAEVLISKAVIMLADEFPDMGFRSPRAYGGTPVSLLIYVADVDEFCRRAMAHPGTRILEPVADKFYGDRSFKMADPFGHVWLFATRIEDVPPDEMERRAAEFFAGTK